MFLYEKEISREAVRHHIPDLANGDYVAAQAFKQRIRTCRYFTFSPNRDAELSFFGKPDLDQDDLPTVEEVGGKVVEQASHMARPLFIFPFEFPVASKAGELYRQKISHAKAKEWYWTFPPTQTDILCAMRYVLSSGIVGCLIDAPEVRSGPNSLPELNILSPQGLSKSQLFLISAYCGDTYIFAG